jgi:hypothetical protein
MTSPLFETWLAVADVALLASAATAFLASRRLKPLWVLDLGGAFGVLERSIQTYVPELPVGYTWGEAFERLKEAGVDTDWSVLKGRLKDYEEYRYGGREQPKNGKEDVLSLALKLRRRSSGKRTKR